jgi:hypothetical protein
MLVSIWECQPLCATHDGCLNFDNPENHWSLFRLTDMVESIEARLKADATISCDEEEEVEA